MLISRYIHWNARNVPERKEGESEQDFQARMEWFRKYDRRVPVAGVGKLNFGFGYRTVLGTGVIGDRMDRPTEKWNTNSDGVYCGTGEYVHEKSQKGGFSKVDA